MKKQIAVFLMAAASIWLMTGCAKTPDTSLVTQKNNDRLKEAALDTEDENRKSLDEVKQSTTDQYTFEYTSEDGKVHISADAQVTLPETSSIPMYSLSCGEFTQEQVTSAFDYLLSGKETWIMTGEDYSKEMADADILEAKQAIAEAESNPDLDEEARQYQIESYQSILDDIQEQYDSLPETANPQKEPVDSTFRTAEVQTLAGAEQYQQVEAHTDEGDSFIAQSFALGSDGSSQIYYEKASGESYYRLENGEVVTEQQADELCKCDLSYAEAKELSDGFLEAVGVPVQLVQVSLQKAGTSLEDEEEQIETITYEEDYSAYCFYYGRIIDGTPVAVTSSQYVPHEDTAPTWLYESIRILVNSEGIVGVDWSFPVELNETIASDVDILEFSDAAAIFEEMAPLVYQGNVEETEDNTTIQSSFDVKVDRVELNLMRIKDSGTERTGLYTPAWVFYGTQIEHLYYMEDQFASDPNLDVTEDTPWIILAVNAIDGSIIDVTAGY